MKKFFCIFSTILIAVATFILSYNYFSNKNPNTFYQVYMNGEVIGVIKSKSELEKYINNENKELQKKYGTDKVYSPNGLSIQRIMTYNGSVDNVKKIYKKIEKLSPFTIRGYQVKINTDYVDESDGKNKVKTEIIYIVNKDDLEKSINSVIETFVGKDKYKAYIDDNQVEITDIGEYIDDVYLDNDITIKEANIPVTEVIYSNSEDLAQYLLYGGNTEEKTYVIKEGDTIESVSYDNQINPEEFLISNPSFTSINNLLFVGQSVIIKQTNPQIQVVEEKTVVEDQVDQFQTIVKYDNNKYIGDDVVEQEGQNGTNRVNMKIKYINNSIAYINTISKNVITPTVDKIVVYGNKYASAVGSTSIWKWPCDSHYITSHFARFRINPVTGRHESHQATDIYNPYNSRIYAANNGTVVKATWHWSYGNYVVIDHNNGFATLYAHMNSIAVKAGQTVNRGQVIGYVGSTGIATGPHLHFEAIKTSNNMKFDAETLRYQ